MPHSGNFCRIDGRSTRATKTTHRTLPVGESDGRGDDSGAMMPVHSSTTSSQQMKIMLEKLQAEFDEFRASSTELEDELERELARVEARARHSEREQRRKDEILKEATGRLTRELLACQQEMTQLRQDREQSLRCVREKEEALEQAAEQERRAQAEVESLREALETSMEMATFTQTELEELKRTSEELNRQLFEDLEEAQAELALVTPVKGDGALSTNSGGRGSGGSGSGSGRWNGGGSGTVAGGRHSRHFFRMASFEEEESYLEAPSAIGEDDEDEEKEEDVSPLASSKTLLVGDNDGVCAERGGDGEGVTAEGKSERFLTQAAELQQGLERQLRLSVASPPPNQAEATTSVTNSHGGSSAGSASSSSSTVAYENVGYRKASNRFDSNGPTSSSSMSVDRSRMGTLVIESEAVVMPSRSEAPARGRSARRRLKKEKKIKKVTSAASGLGGSGSNRKLDDVQGHEGADQSVYDSWEDGESDDVESGCIGGGGGLEHFLRAMSTWRPFAFCQPGS